MENKIYDVDFYINKFESIPEELWLVRSFGGCGLGCVMYHAHSFGLGFRLGLRALFQANKDLFTPLEQCIVSSNGDYEQSVNNGDDPRYQQPTPKARILAALYDIKAKQQPEQPKEKTVYKTVVIDPAVKELQEKILTEN